VSGELAGAIGVDAHVREVAWSDSDVMLCRIVGNALTGMTERKRAAEKLQRERDFSEGLIDSLPGLLYLYDADLRLRRWNRNVEALGFSAAELQGKRMDDWFANDEARQLVVGAARGVLQDRGAIDFVQSEILDKSGSLEPYLFSGAHVTSAEGPMLVGVGINIAARVRAEKALSASERNYRELFDVTNDALFIQDETGQVLAINERACSVFGVDAARAQRLSIEEISLGEPPYSQAEALAWIHRAIDEGPQVFDWRSRRADGTLFWSEVALRAFHSEGRGRVIASVRDITERKLAGLERERLMAEAQAANSAKDQFLAVLSHELRTPLNTVLGYARMLRREDKRMNVDLRARALDALERNADSLTRLVSDVLDTSRIVTGKLRLELESCPLDSVIGDAVQTIEPAAEAKRVSIKKQIDQNLTVMGDRDRLQQVIWNLLSNAIKFTPSGGTVTVHGERRGATIRVAIRDTGIGIAPEHLPLVFHRFWQGHTGASREYGGLGLGLALARHLIELHGGSIAAESAGEGTGSVFTVTLPTASTVLARERSLKPVAK
jgi:PAS domain S-box-containing protein